AARPLGCRDDDDLHSRTQPRRSRRRESPRQRLGGLAAFWYGRRGVRRGGCIPFELALHLLFFFALFLEFLLTLLIPEIGFCQVVFSLFVFEATQKACRALDAPAGP